jgi:hypothetical protein
LDQLRHGVDALVVAHSFEFVHQAVVIKLDEVIEVSFPELRGRARAKEVVEVDGRTAHLDELGPML